MGQLGLGDIRPRESANDLGDNLPFVDLGTGIKPTKIIAEGEQSVCALFDNGKVKCWGSNYFGKLGIGTQDRSRGGMPNQMGDNLPFVELGESEVAIDLAAGTHHVCALIVDGKVKC